MASFKLHPDTYDLYIDSQALVGAANLPEAEVEWDLGNPTGEYADEGGDDPFYDTITITVINGEDEVPLSLTFEDTTIDTIMAWLSALGAEDSMFTQFEVV